MPSLKKIFLSLFIAVSLGELAASVWSLEILGTLCKPAIMFTLGVYYWCAILPGSRSFLLILGILSSCIGDVLLMLLPKNESFFMFGLMAFLIAHVIYILTYRQHRNEGHDDQLRGIQKIRFAFPIVLAGTGMIIVLYPVLGAMQVPVVLYTLVIIVMVLNALFRYGHTTDKSFWMVFTGAVFFMISDSILAINKFLQPIAGATFWIMSSYIVAQFLIVDGLTRHAGKAN
jgi:uncharacterized membrane protein YhhN